jgi:hypothetical protein
VGRQATGPPEEYSLVVQILIGVMAGSSYTPEIGRLLLKVLPDHRFDLVLVAAGFLTSLLLAKMGVLNASTAYLGTARSDERPHLPLRTVRRTRLWWPLSTSSIVFILVTAR